MKANYKTAIVAVAAGAALGGALIQGLIGSALAADMTGAELRAFLPDRTFYVQTTGASSSGQAGQGVIYWAKDGTALFRTANGAMMHGNWEIKDNTLCPGWKERPGAGCTRLDKTEDGIMSVDVASGKVRAKIVKTAVGNAEKLAP